MNGQMELMQFPETFEEFAKEYGFKDNKEVYTNGSDLISIFRVKQWLEYNNKKVLKALEQEPCDDAINRILKRMWNCRGKHTTSIDKVKMEQIIRDELSSVNRQEPKTDVLDRIRAEIEQLPTSTCTATSRINIDADNFKENVFAIIDKYKAESENVNAGSN